MKLINKDGTLVKKLLKEPMRIRTFDLLELYEAIEKNDGTGKMRFLCDEHWEFDYEDAAIGQDRTKKRTGFDYYDHVMDPSLELIKLKECLARQHWETLCLNKKWKDRDGKEKRMLYSDALICLDMKKYIKKCSIPKLTDNKKPHSYNEALRKLYTFGICINGKHYVEYKRSASQAKEGKHIFIITYDHKAGVDYGDILNTMRAWNWMDLSFEDSEPVNWTELKAYEALVDSSLDYSRENEERLFALNRNDILIVGDLKFSFNASKEGDEVCLLRERKMGEMKKGQRGGKLYIDRDDETVKSFEVENMVFDGEGLLDESVFKKLKDEHGMMLLRNRFFKCCAFRTDIQQFYKDHFGDDYKNAVVYDLYGNKRKACDVKLIFTPSSLKFLKLADKVKRSTGKDEDAYVYEYWLNRLGRFGVVKNEKRTKEMDEYWPGKEGYYHPMTYQMLNSLPLRVDDICPWKEGEIGVPNGEYLLKDDLEYFRKIKFEDGAFVSYVSAVGIKMSGDLLRYLIGKNSDFLKTEWGKNTRDKRLENYRTDIKRGHVHIEGDYYVLCSMPMELLRWSAWKKSGMDEASCEREFIKPKMSPKVTLHYKI